MNQQKTMLKRGGGRFWKRPQRQTAERPQAPTLKTPQEIRIMRESGRVVARVHQALREAIRPGVSTWDLDQLAAETMQKLGARSCFLGYRGFPAHTCTSINEELVHGIPSKKRLLLAGDIISIDVGVFYRGFVGDSAWTYVVGDIAPETQRLMEVTENPSIWASSKLWQATGSRRSAGPSSSLWRPTACTLCGSIRATGWDDPCMNPPKYSTTWLGMQTATW